MITLELTLAYNDRPLYIVTTSVAVRKALDTTFMGCYVIESGNTSDGWKVKESYEDVVAMIKKQLESKGE